MGTYKYGRYRQYGWHDGVQGTTYCIIQKKNFWGKWKEFEWWHDTKKGNEKMMKTVEALQKAGNTVYPD